MNKLLVYTDGACEPNPGPGSYAFVIWSENEVYEFNCYVEDKTTNNRMEMSAVIAALNKLIEMKITKVDGSTADVHLFTDSSYVAQGLCLWFQKWAKKGLSKAKNGKLLNADLWQEMHDLACKIPKLSVHIVRGHSGIYGNEIADALCTQAMQKRCGSFETRKPLKDECFFTNPVSSYGFMKTPLAAPTWDHRNATADSCRPEQERFALASQRKTNRLKAEETEKAARAAASGPASASKTNVIIRRRSL